MIPRMPFLIVAILGVFSAANLETAEAPKVVSSKEIIRQIQESPTGFTDREMLEIRKLHDTDSVLLQKIISNSRKNSQLEQYVNTLDISLDTRLLTEAMSDIKQLQKAQKESDDTAREERRSQRDMIRSIWSGTILLVIAAIITGVVHFLRWYWRKKDPGTRNAQHHDVVKLDQNLQAAIGKKDAVDGKFDRIEGHLEFLDKRVDRVGMAAGGSPIT